MSAAGSVSAQPVVGVRRAGERAAVLDVATEAVTPAAASEGLRGLFAAKGIGIRNVVPGAATVLVVATNAVQISAALNALAELPAFLADHAEPAAAVTVELRVRYDGADLTAVAKATGLSVQEVIRRHSDVTYEAAFTGFAPGFAYLAGLDPALHLPRRKTPRPSVPAGSLAIADVYTAVYPQPSPGGWHLLGSTAAVMFDASRSSPSLLRPGSYVRFVAEPGPTP